jgi:hypothetical protein
MTWHYTRQAHTFSILISAQAGQLVKRPSNPSYIQQASFVGSTTQTTENHHSNNNNKLID